MSESTRDLLDFAARRLRVGGRLVYWLPSSRDFDERNLPQHPCLRHVCHSAQVLSFTLQRVLVTMEKTIAFDPSLHSEIDPALLGQYSELAENSIARQKLRADVYKGRKFRPVDAPVDDSDTRGVLAVQSRTIEQLEAALKDSADGSGAATRKLQRKLARLRHVAAKRAENSST